MAIKFGTDGTLYCNSIKYNYKQARNIVADGCYGNISSTWSFSNASAISNNPAGYKSYRCFKLNTNSGTNIVYQSAPTPIAGHKYYGSCMVMTPSSTFTATDARWEWHLSDTSSGVLTFGNKKFATSGQWVKLSSIQSISDVTSGSWVFRNFTVKPSSECYVTRMIVIDLTDTFGSGNEPSKEWCDANIREHETIVNWGCVSANATKSSYPYTAYNFNSGKNYAYLALDSNWEPREYMGYYTSKSGNAEATVNSNKTYSLTPSDYYYAYWEVGDCLNETLNILHYDISYEAYFPTAEPNMGRIYHARNSFLNGGGGMKSWHRKSLFANRTSFSSGSYTFRLDFNNNTYEEKMRFTAWNLIDASTSPINQYNIYNGTSITVSDINRRWCDRWIDARSSPIIHIKDPNNKTIRFKKPMQEMKRGSTTSYTKAQIDAYSTLTNDTWTIVANASELAIGELAFLSVIDSTNNLPTRLVVKVLSVSGTTVTTDNYGYSYSNGYWWGLADGYDIECNDVEIRPELNCIKFDSTGTIKCKKLVCSLNI